MFSNKRYEYVHRVTFEETNLIGNVYFSNYIKWQGLAREMFLANRFEEILSDITEKNMVLVTLNCSCNYLGELVAFDSVLIRMYLLKISQNKIKLKFEYFKYKNDNSEILVAEGTHEIGCFIREGDKMISAPIPKYFIEEIDLY